MPERRTRLKSSERVRRNFFCTRTLEPARNQSPLTSGLSLRACWQSPLTDGGRAGVGVSGRHAHPQSPCACENHARARGGGSSVDTYVSPFFVPRFENNCFQYFSKHQHLQAGLGIYRVNPVCKTGRTLYRKGSDSVNFDLSSVATNSIESTEKLEILSQYLCAPPWHRPFRARTGVRLKCSVLF